MGSLIHAPKLIKKLEMMKCWSQWCFFSEYHWKLHTKSILNLNGCKNMNLLVAPNGYSDAMRIFTKVFKPVL